MGCTWYGRSAFVFSFFATLIPPMKIHSLLLVRRPETDAQFRLAIGSYVEQYSNSVQIIKKKPSPKDPSDAGYSYENQCYVAAEFDHPYPCTQYSLVAGRELWRTRLVGHVGRLLAVMEYVRRWSWWRNVDCKEGGVIEQCKLD